MLNRCWPCGHVQAMIYQQFHCFVCIQLLPLLWFSYQTRVLNIFHDLEGSLGIAVLFLTDRLHSRGKNEPFVSRLTMLYGLGWSYRVRNPGCPFIGFMGPASFVIQFAIQSYMGGILR